jgi:VRR-NUC domain
MTRARWTAEQLAAFREKLALPEIKPKRKLKQIESGIQVEFIKWVRANEAIEPRLKLLFSVPNGGKRGYKTAATMKAEGQRAGVPDIMLPVAVHDVFHGLAIEFKRPKGGRTSDEQKEYQKALLVQGWLVRIETSADDAIAAVKRYLGMKD